MLNNAYRFSCHHSINSLSYLIYYRSSLIGFFLSSYDYTLFQLKKEETVKNQYTVGKNIPQRRLLDTFGDSLRHVNKIYNREFGFTARKVPGHMPHFVDRLIMNDFNERYKFVKRFLMNSMKGISLTKVFS